MIQYSYGIEVKYMMKLIESDRYELKYNYMITDNGEVYSPIYKRFLKPSSDRYGYDQVWLACKDKRRKFLVHRLVMENFSPIENCHNWQVNHIDGDKQNNKLSNLEWSTAKENTDHAIAIGLRKPKDQLGSKNHMAKLSEEKVIEICKLLQTKKYTNKQIANMFNVSESCIEGIRERRNWKHITKDIIF